MWEHVIKYSETKQLRLSFVKDLVKEIVKEKLINININKIFSFIKDILQYLENDDSEKYEINQEMIEMQDLFRGFIIKVWKGIDFSREDYHILNKILVTHCARFYSEC